MKTMLLSQQISLLLVDNHIFLYLKGGISNGESIYFRVAFKPPATIGQEQLTSTYAGESGTLAARGRHDPCVVPRAVAIVEGMAACVIME